MKINGDEYREDRKLVLQCLALRRIREIQDLEQKRKEEQMRKEEHWCKIIVTIIFLLVMVWIFGDAIIKANKKDGYKGDRIRVVGVNV